ncbi:PREDICTED: uncharacterized protein LOC104587362 isoform X2 [Nelumbo nucifera]|nr:PREDICTED: uncharacterized protein LOC104587362 isoform X2 [Nelumbo nucifera]
MVKAAIERGIYFEITYSPLISDIQARRQMISNAKLLVDWTRGKNLIFSSAVPTVNELRGPYDVANLSSLFGLSMERAKAAISKNCRTLIAGSLKKKKYFKEAIKIEKISSGEQMKSEPWFVECHNWDQISSGDGDLLLDDISKMFSSSAEDPKILKAIDFTSISEGTLLNNMQLMDSVYGTGAELQAPDNTSDLLHAAKNPEGLAAVVKVSNQSNCINEVPNENWTSPLKHQTSGSEGFLEPVTPNDTSAVFIGSQKETPKPWDGELRSSNRCDPILATVGTELHDIASRDLMTTSENPAFPGDTTIVPASDACNEPMESGMLDVVSPSKCISPIEGDLVSSVDTLEHSTPSMDIGCLQKNVDAVSGVQDIRMKSVIAERVDQEQRDFHLSVSNVPLQDGFAKAEGIEEHGDGVVPLIGEMQFPESYDEMKGDADLILDDEPLKEVLIETEEQKGVNCQKTQNNTMTLDKSKLGKSRLRRISYRPSPFPFKCLLKHVLFKKSRKIKNRIRIPSHIC